MKKQKISHRYIILIISVLFFQIFNSCQSGRQTVVSDYRLQLGALESVIQSGNWLKFLSDFRADPYTGTLNPGKIVSAGRTYHILKFENRDHQLPYSLQDGDTLSLILDGRAIHLTGYNTSGQGNKLSTYYEIDKWDLIDVGNANTVVAILKARGGKLRATFSKDNIYNYRYFAAKYILGTDDIPPPSEPRYEQPTAFFSAGAGTGTEFWFGYYTNFVQIIEEGGDYLAAGAGFVPFEFSRYNRFPGQGYLWDGNFSEINYSLNLMYGLTYPSPFGNWSFELGFSYQYYFYNEKWNTENSGSENWPTYYRLTDYIPFKGSVFGMFIQAGGLWVQFNQLRDWAVGLTLPIPWW